MNKSSEHIPHSHKILVFDVETTGLLPKYGANELKNYPHILQLSFIIYDIGAKKIVKEFDSYVNIDTNIHISNKITELTGITRELCNNGLSMIEILKEFHEAYVFCNGLVAHNMDFDSKMIGVEIERFRSMIEIHCPQVFTIFNPFYEKIHNITRYCTMKSGTNLCNILIPSKIEGKPPMIKWPKLIELHNYLFNNEPINGLHNSLIDVKVCLRCYLKMLFNIDNDSFL
jgi:DNA polymerase III epsilon subunit-like protein